VQNRGYARSARDRPTSSGRADFRDSGGVALLTLGWFRQADDEQLVGAERPRDVSVETGNRQPSVELSGVEHGAGGRIVSLCPSIPISRRIGMRGFAGIVVSCPALGRKASGAGSNRRSAGSSTPNTTFAVLPKYRTPEMLMAGRFAQGYGSR